MAGAAAFLVLVFLCSFDSVFSFKQLYLNKINADIAQGRYVSSAGVGISFNSTSTTLGIFDLFGNEVLIVHDLLQHQRLIRIQGNTFVQVHISEGHGYRDYYVPKYIVYNEADHYSRRFNVTVLKLLDTLSSYYHFDNLQRSVRILIESPFVDSIKGAVYSLGIDLGLHGDTYPSLLPLYLVANMLEKLQITTLFSNSGRKSCTTNLVKDDGIKDEDCFKECPPCPEEECLSLCGYGCHCWKWVCGDCCYHLGCHGHDICCRKNFIQTKCLFPISFKCESEYSC